MTDAATPPNDQKAYDPTDPEHSGFTGGSGDFSGDQTDKDPERAALLAERDKYLELARRTQAEFENYQKRVRRDSETDRKYAVAPILGDLLPVLDNLERALQSPPTDEASSQFVEGIRLLYKQWQGVLAKYGVQQIQAVGQPFDPNLHEAIMQQPSADYPPMTVLAETRSGYVLHDRVLRPAQVIVSAAAS